MSENKGVAGDAAVEVALSNNVVTVSRRGFALKVLRQRLGRVVLNPTTSLPIRRNSWYEIPGETVRHRSVLFGTGQFEV